MSFPFALQIYMLQYGTSQLVKDRTVPHPHYEKRRILPTGLSSFQRHTRKFGIFWRNGSPVAAEISDVLIMCELAL